MRSRISLGAGVTLKFLIVALFFSLSLIACTTSPNNENEKAISTQERMKRQQAQRWNQTTATGTATGAGVGALIGGLVAGRGGALMGAGVGALVGLAAGALVAERNLTFENREATASERIASARDIADCEIIFYNMEHRRRKSNSAVIQRQVRYPSHYRKQSGSGSKTPPQKPARQCAVCRLSLASAVSAGSTAFNRRNRWTLFCLSTNRIRIIGIQRLAAPRSGHCLP